jgi:hypothetical protein
MIEANPFAVLTFIAAPAILTNASSVLALGTSNRFARVIDRSRELSAFLEEEKGEPEMARLWGVELDRCERRAEMIIQALKSFYLAVGSFAGASLISLVGATLSVVGAERSVRVALIFAVIVGTVGLMGLAIGGAVLVRETGLTLKSVREENALIRQRMARRTRRAIQVPASV